ncbi:MAG: hypothetical protein CMK41_01140 [Porticoccaceae bacterium]|nr:hypothetical protein [Porticoccaceae bacterium]|tara:strand:+ start:134 stop:361 length:228 start_codon:yes stop_codon:yes gene_type:complete
MKYTQFIFLNLIFMSGLVADETNTAKAQVASNESDEIIANDVKESQTLDQSTQSNDFDPDEEISEDFPVPIPYDI